MPMTKVVTILGARPQFIKAAPVRWAFRDVGVQEVLINTGQHYDFEMAGSFLKELNIGQPDVDLNVSGETPDQQLGKMIPAIADVIRREQPDWVLVYGDTTSTLGGALAATLCQVPLAHVEAGLRSYNRTMPEERNRVLTDHASDIFFCPTSTAKANLEKEGLVTGVHVTGDTMYDLVKHYEKRLDANILNLHSLVANEYAVATLHRPYNVDSPDILASILKGLNDLSLPVVLPLHPRTRARLQAMDGDWQESYGGIRFIDPVGFNDMIALQKSAAIVMTDSGGVQKEALFVGRPCVTIRPETEWVETVESGWNVLSGTTPKEIHRAVEKQLIVDGQPPSLFGDGRAAAKIADILAG